MSVYFIRAENGLIKIGHAEDVIARLSKLQASSPVPLVLMASMTGGEREERALHRMFSTVRNHGEWFKPSARILRSKSGCWAWKCAILRALKPKHAMSRPVFHRKPMMRLRLNQHCTKWLVPAMTDYCNQADRSDGNVR